MERHGRRSRAENTDHEALAGNLTVRAAFEREADDIERLFNALSIPLRVQGGELIQDRIRYHLAPHARATATQVHGALRQLSASLGSREVRLLRDVPGLALEIERQAPDQLMLLPLLNVLGEMPPHQAALGMDDRSRPLVLDLAAPASWHLLAAGPAGCGKSELLRTVMVALALGTPPSEAQFLGLDPSGRELTLLEALPHRLVELAVEPRYADELLHWLSAEVTRRMLPGRAVPHLYLFVDDLDWLTSCGIDGCRERLQLLLDKGPQAGVHLILGANLDRSAAPNTVWNHSSLIQARGRSSATHAPGVFAFPQDGLSKQAQMAWLPARDLNSAARLIEAVWLGSRGGR